MDLNSKIIRLGKNKSPPHARVSSDFNQRNKESPLSPIENQRQSQIHYFSQTMHLPSRNFDQHQKFSKTNPTFYSPQIIKIQQNFDHRDLQQIQNRQVPFHTTNIVRKHSQGAQNLILGHADLLSQRQHLIRKNKTLQARIKQLHEQKNEYILKANDNTKKLSQENQELKRKLNDFENLKNQYSYFMKKQLNNLGGPSKTLRFEQLQKTAKPLAVQNNSQSIKQKALSNTCRVSPSRVNYLKNSAYTYHQRQDITSICMQTSRKDTATPEESELKKNQHQRLGQLQKQFNQKKKQWQQKEKYYQKQLIQANETKSKLQSIQKTLLIAQENNQYYIQKVLSNSQNDMKIKEQHTIKINNLNKIIEAAQSRTRIAEQKLKKLQATTQDNSTQKQCQKCRQLVKTLVKLNQKVCTKTF